MQTITIFDIVNKLLEKYGSNFNFKNNDIQNDTVKNIKRICKFGF